MNLLQLATDVGKRLLMELGVDHTNLQETYLVEHATPAFPNASRCIIVLCLPDWSAGTCTVSDSYAFADSSHQAMKELDANGDGRVDRAEFVNWMASRAVKLA